MNKKKCVMNFFFPDRGEQGEVCAGPFICIRSSRIRSFKKTNSPFLRKNTVKCFGKNFSVGVKIDRFFHPEAVECQKNSLQNVTVVLWFL